MLPAGFDAPRLVAIHRGSQPLPRLAQVIGRGCALPVKEAAAMDVVIPGHACMALRTPILSGSTATSS